MTYMTTWKHIRPALERVMTEAALEYPAAELWEDNADDYGFHLSFTHADVSLTLEDAMSYEGDDGKGKGALSLRAVERGGRILAECTPFNFTRDVWVRLSPAGWPELQDRLDQYIAPALLDVCERAAHPARSLPRL